MEPHRMGFPLVNENGSIVRPIIPYLSHLHLWKVPSSNPDDVARPPFIFQKCSAHCYSYVWRTQLPFGYDNIMWPLCLPKCLSLFCIHYIVLHMRLLIFLFLFWTSHTAFFQTRHVCFAARNSDGSFVDCITFLNKKLRQAWPCGLPKHAVQVLCGLTILHTYGEIKRKNCCLVLSA